MRVKIVSGLLVVSMFSACHPVKLRSSAHTFPDVITADTANKMLSSYLNSINYQSNDTDIQSIFFNAGLIRYYLDSLSGSDSITQFKLMFAHTLGYINAGHGNQPAGYKSGALTILIAGYSNNGNIVFIPDREIIDNGAPCPTNCPPGEAGQPLIPIVPSL